MKTSGGKNYPNIFTPVRLLKLVTLVTTYNLFFTRLGATSRLHNYTRTTSKYNIYMYNITTMPKNSLLTLPPQLIRSIFNQAYFKTPMRAKQTFGYSNLNKRGKQKSMLPLLSKNYYKLYNDEVALRNNVIGNIWPPNKRRKVNTAYPTTRSATRLRKRVNNLTRRARSARI